MNIIFWLRLFTLKDAQIGQLAAALLQMKPCQVLRLIVFSTYKPECLKYLHLSVVICLVRVKHSWFFLCLQVVRPHAPLIKFPNRKDIAKPNGECALYLKEAIPVYLITYCSLFVTLPPRSPGGVEGVRRQLLPDQHSRFTFGSASTFTTSCTFDSTSRNARHAGLCSAADLKVPQETAGAGWNGIHSGEGSILMCVGGGGEFRWQFDL